MPRKREWLDQVPAALEQLREYPAPVIDRAALERLLHIQRREAIRLLHTFGGYMAGKTFLIAREDLIRQLEEVAASGDYERESRRRLRLVEELARTRKELAARQVVIQTPADVWSRQMADLPAGIRLERNKLEIEFRDTEDLLRQLMELAQAIANDFSTFDDWITKELTADS